MVTRDQGKVVVRTSVPNAQDVHLIGPFNNWSNLATPMTRRLSGDWEVTLPDDAELAGSCFFVWDRGRPLGRVWGDALCG